MEANSGAPYKNIFEPRIALKDNEQLILEEGQVQDGLNSPVNQVQEPLDGFGGSCLVS